MLVIKLSYIYSFGRKSQQFIITRNNLYKKKNVVVKLEIITVAFNLCLSAIVLSYFKYQNSTFATFIKRITAVVIPIYTRKSIVGRGCSVLGRRYYFIIVKKMSRFTKCFCVTNFWWALIVSDYMRRVVTTRVVPAAIIWL